MSQLKILRTYAKLDDASIAAKKLPPTVYFSHTPHTLTIFDAYPKALFHFLILPRLQPASSTASAPTTLTLADNDNDSDDEIIASDDGAKGERRDADPALLLADSETTLTSLRTLLQGVHVAPSPPSSSSDAKARERARGTLRVLADEATRLRGEIEREMRARYGFAWAIWIGFHAVPSME